MAEYFVTVVDSCYSRTGTKCIWSPPTFATGCRFFAPGIAGSRPDLVAELNGRRKEEWREGNGTGEIWMEQQRETEKERRRKEKADV